MGVACSSCCRRVKKAANRLRVFAGLGGLNSSFVEVTVALVLTVPVLTSNSLDKRQPVRLTEPRHVVPARSDSQRRVGAKGDRKRAVKIVKRSNRNQIVRLDDRRAGPFKKIA